MEEKQKVQVVFEFDRSEYDAYLFLMNQKKTEEDCEYIYMLKDWELSKGAKLELDVASSCGIKVLFE